MDGDGNTDAEMALARLDCEKLGSLIMKKSQDNVPMAIT
jgi:hypothetical protein